MAQRSKFGQRILLAAGLVGTMPGWLAAQGGVPAALSEVRSGAYVRARLGADRQVTGNFVPVDDGRVGIRSDQGMIDTLRLRDIGELAVRGRHTKTGAIVGGVAGVGFGLFIGWIVTNTCDAADCDSGAYAVTVPLFGAAGTLAGAAIGRAFPKWKKVYP